MTESTTKAWTRVARVSLPPQTESDTLPLYLDFGQAPLIPTDGPSGSSVLEEHRSDLVRPDGTVVLPESKRLSFATVFNAFPASYWRTWTVAENVKLTVRIKGSANVLVYKSNASGRAQLVDQDEVSNDVVEFKLSLKGFADGGWYWFDLVAVEDDAVFVSGEWSVDAVPAAPVKISIGITTFNRPDYCAETIRTIGAAEHLTDIVSHVYVVDQGNQHVIDDPLFPEAAALLGDRLEMIYQANMGGSGGFSRGMYEAVQAGDVDFHLLLDDDVTVHPESIERLAVFASLCRRRTIVGGQMFDLNAKSVAHSFGEAMNKWRWWWGPVAGTENGIDLASANLRRRPTLHRRLDVDYNGWWMCLIPVSVIKEIGLSLPIFIKWDDAEYGIRAQEIGVNTVTLPGAGLWHISWADKDDSRDWQAYFHERNRILTALLHSPYDRGGRLLYELTTMDVKHSVSAEYYAETIRLMAIEDILSGPQHLHETIKTRLPQVRALAQEFSDAQYKTDPDAFPSVSRTRKPKFKTQPKPPTMATLVPWTLSTVAKQLMPIDESSLETPEASVSHADSKFWVLSQYDSMLVTKADGTGQAWYRRDPKQLRSLLARSAAARVKLLRNWDSLSKQYREAMKDVVSLEAWEPTFDMDNPEFHNVEPKAAATKGE